MNFLFNSPEWILQWKIKLDNFSWFLDYRNEYWYWYLFHSVVTNKYSWIYWKREREAQIDSCLSASKPARRYLALWFPTGENVERDNMVRRNVNTADANASRRTATAGRGNSLFVKSNKGSLSPAGSPRIVALVAYLYAIGGSPLHRRSMLYSGASLSVAS